MREGGEGRERGRVRERVGERYTHPPAPAHRDGQTDRQRGGDFRPAGSPRCRPTFATLAARRSPLAARRSPLAFPGCAAAAALGYSDPGRIGSGRLGSGATRIRGDSGPGIGLRRCAAQQLSRRFESPGWVGPPRRGRHLPQAGGGGGGGAGGGGDPRAPGGAGPGPVRAGPSRPGSPAGPGNADENGPGPGPCFPGPEARSRPGPVEIPGAQSGPGPRRASVNRASTRRQFEKAPFHSLALGPAGKVSRVAG